MKTQRHVKQARAKGSGETAKQQEQKAGAESNQAAPATVPEETPRQFALRFLMVVAQLQLMVCNEVEKVQKRGGNETRLRIILRAMDTLLEQGSGFLTETPFKGVMPDSNMKPFGTVEPPHEVEMARYLIWDEWKRCLTLNAHDALGGNLISLHDCIRHHPGLRTEMKALDAMNSGDNELIRLMNAEKSGRWDGRKLNGAESWFAKKLNAAHGGEFRGYLGLLEDARMIFERDPRGARVADAIQKIIRGQEVFNKVRSYLDAI